MKGTFEYDEQEVWALVETRHQERIPAPLGYHWQAGPADYMGRGVKVKLVNDEETGKEA